MCHPEKGQQIDAIRPRAVRSLQSALRTKFREIRACFPYFVAKGGAVSLQLRLYGGEGGIRTLGTGISQYNGLANLSFDAVPAGFNGLQADYLTLVGPYRSHTAIFVLHFVLHFFWGIVMLSFPRCCSVSGKNRRVPAIMVHRMPSPY